MPAQLDSLTGLRWIAAFMVFLSHVFLLPTSLPQGQVGDSIRTFTSLGGYVGVSVFFVLSGFVLTWSARATDTAPKFWRRRFFKIYPNHFVALLIATAFMVWLGQNFGFLPVGEQLPGLLPQLLLVHAWLPDLSLAFSFNLVSWSLSVEALFYLSFPLVLAGIRRIRPERLWFWVVAMAAVVFCVPQVARLLPAGEIAYEGLGSWEYWFIYVLPVSRLAEFVIGMLMARIVLSGRWIRVPAWLTGLVFLAGYVVALNVPKNYAIVAATVIPIALLIPAVATADVRGGRSWLAKPVMVWLGNISYAFYLLHFFGIVTVVYLLGWEYQPTWLTSTGFVLGVLALGVVLSTLLYRLVERPMQRRFATSRKSRVQPPSPATEVEPA